MSITERTLSPDQRAILLTILGEVAAIRTQLRVADTYNPTDVTAMKVYAEEHLDAIARKVREINGGGLA